MAQRKDNKNVRSFFKGGHNKDDIPGDPFVTLVSSDRVDIEWEPANTFCPGDNYEVQIRKLEDGKRTFNTFTTCRGTIANLEPATKYTFEVCLQKANGTKCQYKTKSLKVKTMGKSKQEFAGKGIPLEKPLSFGNVDKESEPVDDLQDGATQNHKNYTENDNRDLNTSSDEYFEQPASCMIDEGAKGDKYSENTKQAITPSSLKVDQKGIPSGKTLSSENADNESYQVDDTQDGATQNHNPNIGNDNLDHNKSSEERFEQAGSSMINEGPNGGKYSKNTDQAITTDASSPEVDLKKNHPDKPLPSEKVDIESKPVDNSQARATQNRKKNTENDKRDCNTSSEGIKQAASSMIDEVAQGGKYSENTEQAITTDAFSPEVDRPGKPAIKRVSRDSIDIKWDAVTSFCNGDVYQVRYENTTSGKWNCQICEINSGTIVGLEPGNSYIFNVRLVKSDGEEGKYGEKSEEVKTQLEQDLPGKPSIKGVSSDSVDIIWGAVPNLSTCDVYEVRIDSTKDKKWHCLNFETNSGKILDLKPSTSYTFKVRLIKGTGEEGKHGETSEEVTTKVEPIPGKPCVQRVFADSVYMIWEQVDTLGKGDVYEVHVENNDTKETICHKFDTNCATIKDLQPDSTYIFKVRSVSQNGKMSKFSDNSDEVTTCSTHASNLKRKQCPVETACTGTELFELPFHEVQHAKNAAARSSKYEIGRTGRGQIVEKTIMLVGATGTGKTTFVDSLANYILGVRLTDPYRFTVMRKEDREKQKDQAISQTDWIRSFTFNPEKGTRLTYRLNVIDTPGFGDTQGPERDRDIIDQIHRLFKEPGEKGVQTIDAVCFFVKASDSRLTQEQAYIFNEMMSLFGKDIKDNICLLITFADGLCPLIMDAVRTIDLPYGKSFLFNNRPWSSDPKKSPASTFWNMSLNSYTELFKYVGTLETKSLQLTKEVLKERQILELTCQNLYTKINDTMSVMHSIDKKMTVLLENIDEIDTNKNFTYKVTELKAITVVLPPNERATNCKTCKTTCHRNCSSFFQRFPRMCRAISFVSGKCTQCKCDSNCHETTGYRYDTCEEEVEKTFGDMPKEFQDPTIKVMTLYNVVKNMKGEQNSNIAKTKKLINDMFQCKNRLNNIALLSVQLSMHEHIEQLIKEEKSEAKPGFQNRIEQLKQFYNEVSLLEGSQNTAIESDS